MAMKDVEKMIDSLVGSLAWVGATPGMMTPCVLTFGVWH